MVSGQDVSSRTLFVGGVDDSAAAILVRHAELRGGTQSRVTFALVNDGALKLLTTLASLSLIYSQTLHQHRYNSTAPPHLTRHPSIQLPDSATNSAFGSRFIMTLLQELLFSVLLLTPGANAFYGSHTDVVELTASNFDKEILQSNGAAVSILHE